MEKQKKGIVPKKIIFLGMLRYIDATSMKIRLIPSKKTGEVMSWGVENEERRKGILALMDISEKIMRENPNHVNEVRKSDSGCWMEQIYGILRCDFCDLSPDCPIREEQLWQEYLKANNIVIEKNS